MKLISWNVNGFRAILGKGFLEYFTQMNADVFCIQETKMQEGQVSLELEGYKQYWNSAVKKGYSGTAIFTKIKPLSVKYGLNIEQHDNEGRVITLEFNEFYLVNVYTPNSQNELARLVYRMTWDEAFAEHIKQLDYLKPVIVCGDLNVAHMEIDIKNPKTNRRSAGFTDEERGKLTKLLGAGFIDTFRTLYPNKTDAYSWWSYMMKARERNIGWRIDYFIASKRLKSLMTDSIICDNIMGSDHCPVLLQINIDEEHTDMLFQINQGEIQLEGLIDDKIKLVIDNTLKAIDYTKMVDYFRYRNGVFAAGEFWGKIVRAACLSYKYTLDANLKAILDDSVTDLLSVQDENGCISNFTVENQPFQSDLWERKYLLLGLLGYYEICEDDRALQAMIKLADCTISQVGMPPKVRITDTGWAFYGIESSSILEPIMKLYNLTGFQRYLDFAKYIVEEEGACKRENIFEAIYNGKDPKDVGGNGIPSESIAKAYEMMSCFEGLIEYYRVTKNVKWKDTAIKFYNKLIEQEITIIGSGGADKPYNLGPGIGEQWNYTKFEQTNPDITLMQETCVTVTWMKLCYQLLRLTGDSKIADQIEKSIYNALLGAVKPEGNYFEYFPGLKGCRSSKINFGYTLGDFPLSCCTANGPMGMALIPFFAIMQDLQGPVINLFAPLSSTIKLDNGNKVNLQIATEYPKLGAVVINVTPDSSEQFSIKVRIPEWSIETKLYVNDESFPVVPGTYFEITRKWVSGDCIKLLLDLRCKIIHSHHLSSKAGTDFQAIIRGPIVLCRDKRAGGDVNEAIDITADEDGYVELTPIIQVPDAQMQFLVPSSNEAFSVIDYASAGSTWSDDSEYRAWILRK